MYQRFPRVDSYDCWAVSLGGGKGPTVQGAAPSPPPSLSSSLPSFTVVGGDDDDDDDEPKLSVVLPDLSDGTWKYDKMASSLGFLESRRRNDANNKKSMTTMTTTTSVGEQVDLFSPRRFARKEQEKRKPIKPVAFSKTLETGVTDKRYGSYVSKWTFWVDANAPGGGAPLRLEALSKNLWTGGHYDLTIAEFSGFRPGKMEEREDKSVFEIPPGCPLEPPPDFGSGEDGSSSRRRSRSVVVGAPPLPTDFLSLALPNRHSGHSLYDRHIHSSMSSSSGPMRARRTRNKREYRLRAEAFARAVELVEEHNRDPESSYKLAINHLADLLPHEKKSAQGGLISEHPRSSQGQEQEFSSPSSSSEEKIHAPSVPFDSLPATVDWRGTGADSPVKDQAMCGSCWAFGTVGALEAAVFRETGKQILLSEQQLVDCAWSPKSYKGKSPNAGCYGGYQTTAFDWYFARGSAASQESYPYRGVNNFCDTSVSDAVAFDKANGDDDFDDGDDGFNSKKLKKLKSSTRTKYVWVGGGAQGLREALLTKGPMTVSVDASSEDFTLYSSGIYNNSKCETKLSRLDHAVLISGYGEDPVTKQRFYIVKNTWSVRWGEEGYVRIAVRPDDCGISSQPLYLELGGVREL